MDRLGRNEFIGEVRVALKKLKEGENKRYNMGLERIAQVRAHVHTCIIFSWVCGDVFPYMLFGFFLCQNKDSNNQTVEPGAPVAEEEVCTAPPPPRGGWLQHQLPHLLRQLLCALLSPAWPNPGVLVLQHGEELPAGGDNTLRPSSGHGLQRLLRPVCQNVGHFRSGADTISPGSAALIALLLSGLLLLLHSEENSGGAP